MKPIGRRLKSGSEGRENFAVAQANRLSGARSARAWKRVRALFASQPVRGSACMRPSISKWTNPVIRTRIRDPPRGRPLRDGSTVRVDRGDAKASRAGPRSCRYRSGRRGAGPPCATSSAPHVQGQAGQAIFKDDRLRVAAGVRDYGMQSHTEATARRFHSSSRPLPALRLPSPRRVPPWEDRGVAGGPLYPFGKTDSRNRFLSLFVSIGRGAPTGRVHDATSSAPATWRPALVVAQPPA